MLRKCFVINQKESRPTATVITLSLKEHSTVFSVEWKQKRIQFWLFPCIFFSHFFLDSDPKQIILDPDPGKSSGSNRIRNSQHWLFVRPKKGSRFDEPILVTAITRDIHWPGTRCWACCPRELSQKSTAPDREGPPLSSPRAEGSLRNSKQHCPCGTRYFNDY